MTKNYEPATAIEDVVNTQGGAVIEKDAVSSGSKDHPLMAEVDAQFAHPNWFYMSEVWRAARNLAAHAKYEKRKNIYPAFCKVWHLKITLDFEHQIKTEILTPSFAGKFVANGGSEAALEAIRLMYRMAREEMKPHDFWPLKKQLGALVPRIIPSSDSSPAWSELERQTRTASIKMDPRVLAVQQDIHRQALARTIERQEKATHAAALAKLEKEKAEEVQRNKEKALRAWLLDEGVIDGVMSLETYTLLQDSVRARDFKEIFGCAPSPVGLRNALSLSTPVYQTLIDHQAEIDRQAQAARDARHAWERSLVPGHDVPDKLFITKAEYSEWLADGRLPAIKQKAGPKSAKEKNTLVLHDPADLALLTPKKIEAFRKKDCKGMTSELAALRQHSIEKLKAKQVLVSTIASIPARHDCRALPATPTRLSWVKDLQIKVPVKVTGKKASWPAQVQMAFSTEFPKKEGEVLALTGRVGEAFSKAKQAELAQILSAGVESVLAEYAGALTASELTQLCEALQGMLTAGLKALDVTGNVKNLLTGPVVQMLKTIEETRAHELIKLRDYPQAFSVARSLDRRIHFKIGPTNSGKTHEAIEALKSAKSGLYLAPLRLLAMEIRDRLTLHGIPCNLMTGEEHDIVPGALHTACTVEMMDSSREVQVAVLDEVQMLLDEQRGWAWTSALVGAPARDVYICGADTVHQSCLKVLDALGEKHTTTHLKRKTPLVIENLAVRGTASKKSGKGLLAGDAVIAFSRKDVLTLSARYRAQGFNVSTIYGALAPEVRRTESERFATGESDIVVATDAIGMGLNLPIRRTVFSSVHKFDGVVHRPLNPTELRQIAGRAGRFGMHPQGLVSALANEDFSHIHKMLAAVVPDLPILLPIAPSLWHLQALSNLLDSTSIEELLTFFATRIAADSSLFKTASLEDTISLAQVVDRQAPNLSLEDKFMFSCAPISRDKENELIYFEKCLKAFVMQRKLRLPEEGDWLSDRFGNNLEEAEHLSKDLSLYAWLGFKSPDIFYQSEAVPALRSRVSRYIEKALLRQGGFGQTSREAFENRKHDRR